MSNLLAPYTNTAGIGPMCSFHIWRAGKHVAGAVLILVIIWGLSFEVSRAQTPSSPASADSVHGADPNTVPYETDRSIAYHVLAAPAYLLHGVTRPIGWSILYLERNYPELFEPVPRVRGILPLIELGGPVGAQAGLALYDKRLFGTRQQGRLEGMIGSRNYYEIEASYRVPRLLGPRTDLTVDGEFSSEPRDRFYFDGAQSDLVLDEARFALQQLDVTARLAYRPEGKAYHGAVNLLYEHSNASPSDGSEDERLDATPGLTTLNLLTPHIELGLDFTRGTPRTYAGTEVLLWLDYTHDLGSDRFRYGRYAAAIHQYVPVFFLPQDRRLAFRAYLERVKPIFGGDAVPFYQLPGLGGRRSLRGFISDRFRGNGTLLLTAEYRYPIWSSHYPARSGLDAVFFVDTGQVFASYSDIAVNDFRTSVGGGFHLLNSQGLSFRFEVARSVEATRLVLTVRPAFSRTPR